jgi:cytosine/adenosine deaminase-related metal-dependent hydrolase
MSLRKASAIVASIAFAVIALVAALFYSTFGTERTPRVAATDFVLPDVTTVTPRIERLSDQDVGIAGGLIERVGPAASVLSPAALKEFRGMYVLPGLFDMHMHFPPGNILHLTEHALLLYLAHGVTGVRALGDLTGTSDPAAREALAHGVPGPEMFTCGPFVAGTRALRWPNTIIVNRPEEAEGVVDRIRAAGNVCVKAYEDLSPEKLRALREATAKREMAMPGHVPYGLDYVAGDVPEVQHYLGVPKPSTLKRDHLIDRSFDWSSVDDVRLDEVVQATLRNGTINLPTLVSTSQFLAFRDVGAARTTPAARLLPRLYRDVVWDPRNGTATWRGVDRRIAEIEDSHWKKLKLTRRLFEAGAPLLIGTDAGQPFVPPGLSVHIEMREFAAAGIPIEDVLAIATWKAADRLGRPDLGRVRAGARASLIVFREDPTKDLAALSTIEAVIVDGKLYRRTDLDRALAAWDRHFDNPLFDAISTRLARTTLDKAVLRNY